MALEIKPTPVLKGAAAIRFIKEAEKTAKAKPDLREGKRLTQLAEKILKEANL